MDAEKWKEQVQHAEQKLEMKFVHETIMDIYKPLVPCESIWFANIVLGRGSWLCFSVTVQDYCDIPQGSAFHE